MCKLKDVLGFLWALPVSILGWVFCFFLLILQQIESVQVLNGLIFVWDLSNTGFFFKKVMSGRGWAGFSVGNNIVVLDSDTDRWLRTIDHEAAHCRQWYSLGVLFPLVYIGESVYLYFFEEDLHSYYDNYFEIEARKSAGQLVEIPRTQWKDGATDRWAWW